ncbi:MAG: hypothetical protein PUE01_03990 [Clostridiaceae bacterium]|nr:hypothetical protein [Clostridiaceae bacterium]
MKDKTINGPWSIEYTINANNYDGEIDKHNINIPVSFKDNSSINIDSYSYTNTGLKIYATDTTSQEILDKFAEENQWLKDFVNYGGFTFPTIFFKGTDNLGNNYLFYPGGDKEEPKKITFRIYEPENNSAGYATEINKDATEIKLVLNQKDDNNYNVDIPLTDPITIKLK